MSSEMENVSIYDAFQLQRAVLGFLVISTLGFLAAFLVTNKGIHAYYAGTLDMQLKLVLDYVRGKNTLAHCCNICFCFLGRNSPQNNERDHLPG